MQDLPDKTGISLVCINNEKEMRRWNVDAIARDLGSDYVQRSYPVYLVFYKGSIRGYFQLIPQVGVYTTLHPELMNIREYLKITRSLISEIKRTYRNPLFMLCDRALNAGARVLKHVRLKRPPETAFIYDDDAY